MNNAQGSVDGASRDWSKRDRNGATRSRRQRSYAVIVLRVVVDNRRKKAAEHFHVCDIQGRGADIFKRDILRLAAGPDRLTGKREAGGRSGDLRAGSRQA